jgi:Base plate wedge protein 53
MATHTPFFDFFPKVPYDINRSQYPTYDFATNIFFRLAIIKDILNNTSSYFIYDIDGNDTPEIVAEKVYGDSGANWIVIYANQILDPQFDWVMDDQTFNKYLIHKYGSVEAAQTTAHHYEKVVETTVNGYTTTSSHVIDRSRKSTNIPTVPYETFSDFLDEFSVDATFYTVDATDMTIDTTIYSEALVHGSINDEVNKTYNTYNINGQTVDEVSYARMVTCYDYEAEINDSRRQIKVIKNTYYNQIMQEFKNFVGFAPSYLRTVA